MGKGCGVVGHCIRRIMCMTRLAEPMVLDVARLLVHAEYLLNSMMAPGSILSGSLSAMVAAGEFIKAGI